MGGKMLILWEVNFEITHFANQDGVGGGSFLFDLSTKALMAMLAYKPSSHISDILSVKYQTAARV